MSSLAPPPLQTQSFSQILSEALVRIPVHNPEYTNYQNNTDPGVTILQLFAFMMDNLSYLCNQIPDQNLLKFLSLLGIPMNAPQAAAGMVTFSNTRGPLQVVTLAPQLPVFAGSTGFVTSDGLDVLPVETMIFTRNALSPGDQNTASQTYNQLYASYANPPATQLQFYQTTVYTPPTSQANLPVITLGDGSIVDRAIWIALLSRAVDAGANQVVASVIADSTVTLGIVPVPDSTDAVLEPASTTSSATTSPLIYEISTGQTSNGLPIYQTLNSIADNDPLTKPTLVQLTLPSDASQIGTWTLGPLDDGTGDYPPSLQDQTGLASRVVAWIRVRLPNPGDGQAPNAAVASFNWLGINASKVSQQIQVPVEIVGTGNGEPDQSYTLMNTPVLTSTVQLTIDGTTWAQTQDLLTAPSEIESAAGSQQYEVDSASGTLTFGTGLEGARPLAGSQIIAAYCYGGGVAGNVGIGAINSSPQLPAGFLVSNPLPTSGGTAGETPEQATARIPLYLQNAGRAVSALDFQEIVLSTPGIDLGRVEILPLYQPDTEITNAAGVVTVMVIPNDPQNPQGPVPDPMFLQAVCNYLEPRRLLTTEIYVVGPDYQNISVSVGFDIVPGQDVAIVTEGVKAAISNYLSPLTGGPSGTGWPLQKPLVTLELLVQAARVNGISEINQVLMWDNTGTQQTSIAMTNLELPCLTQVGANVGSTANPLAPPSAGTTINFVPVPVLPSTC